MRKSEHRRYGTDLAPTTKVSINLAFLMMTLEALCGNEQSHKAALGVSF